VEPTPTLALAQPRTVTVRPESYLLNPGQCHSRETDDKLDQQHELQYNRLRPGGSDRRPRITFYTLARSASSTRKV
jgi:hypothetical protein